MIHIAAFDYVMTPGMSGASAVPRGTRCGLSLDTSTFVYSTMDQHQDVTCQHCLIAAVVTSGHAAPQLFRLLIAQIEMLKAEVHRLKHRD